MRRGAAYAASGTTLPDQSCESKLSQHIQQLAVCRMLSKEWLKVHISLYLVTNTALLQHKPYKDGDPHTTLWEGNEVAARLVLETGRVNVLLRCCVVPRDELKQHVRQCLPPAPCLPQLAQAAPPHGRREVRMGTTVHPARPAFAMLPHRLWTRRYPCSKSAQLNAGCTTVPRLLRRR